MTTIWTTAGETFATTCSRELSKSRSRLADLGAFNLTASASANGRSAVCAYADVARSKQAIPHFIRCNVVIRELAQLRVLEFAQLCLKAQPVFRWAAHRAHSLLLPSLSAVEVPTRACLWSIVTWRPSPLCAQNMQHIRYACAALVDSDQQH